jgi:hypothetical protein
VCFRLPPAQAGFQPSLSGVGFTYLFTRPDPPPFSRSSTSPRVNRQ